jgi:hypothetical protein
VQYSTGQQEEDLVTGIEQKLFGRLYERKKPLALGDLVAALLLA